jgi:hypothetical protein
MQTNRDLVARLACALTLWRSLVWISLSALALAVSPGCGKESDKQPAAGTSVSGGTRLVLAHAYIRHGTSNACYICKGSKSAVMVKDSEARLEWRIILVRLVSSDLDLSTSKEDYLSRSIAKGPVFAN